MTIPHPVRHALLGLAALSLLAPRPAAADTQIYVSGSGGEFGTLDLTSGTNFGDFTSINSNLGTTPDGLGYGSDGSLYGVAGTSVYQIDPTAGAITNATDVTGQQSYTAAVSGGTFYNLTIDSSASFFSINPTKASEVVVNPTTGINVDGVLGINGNTLYAADSGGSAAGTDDLYSIDTVTGAVTLVGDTGEGNSSGFAFLSGVYVDNTLFGFGTNKSIYTISTATGDATFDGSYDLGDNCDSIGAATAIPNASPAPEPSQIAMLGMLGIGLSGLIVRARRRTVGA